MDLADRIRAQGDLASRPGQYDDLYDIADELEHNYVQKGWPGLMEILDEVYPADIFVGEAADADPGPRIINLLRQINDIRTRRHG